MSCSNTVTISQGNTFACTFAWTPGASGPANLLTTTLTSDFEDRAGTVYPLTVVTANDGLSFTVSYPNSTADWTLGLGRWDIKFAFPGPPAAISRTEVFRVLVIDSVTV
jgi:hypothetical protein